MIVLLCKELANSWNEGSLKSIAVTGGRAPAVTGAFTESSDSVDETVSG